ncbi:MAG: alpha/beta hydrolase [Sphingobium sp.]
MENNRKSWSLPGVHLHGNCRGPLPSAIFLHGFGGARSGWDYVWDRLASDIGAIRYDLRGFGESIGETDDSFSHADDLLALMDAEGLESADLVGISMGGSVAVNFALDYPDRVRRLVLISTGLMGWDWSPEWRALWRPLVALARAGDMDGARQLWAAHPLFATTRADPDAAALLQASIDRYSGAQWVEDRQRSTLPDLDRLPSLIVPTLLLSGAHDLADFRLIADMIAGSVPKVRRIDLPRQGHMLTLEAPDACADAIETFLRGD